VLWAASALVEVVAARIHFEAGDDEHAERLLALADTTARTIELRAVAGPASLIAGDVASRISRALESIANDGNTRRAPVANRRLTVGRDAEWFSVDDGPRIDLRNRRTLSRILEIIADARRHGEHGVSAQALIAAAWPDERILPRAAKNRLYFAVHALRRLGLRDVLFSREGTYFIPASVDVVRETEVRTPSGIFQKDRPRGTRRTRAALDPKNGSAQCEPDAPTDARRGAHRGQRDQRRGR
jgi:hypothetical protein